MLRFAKSEVLAVRNRVMDWSNTSCTTKVTAGSGLAASVLERRLLAISLPIAPRPMKPMVLLRSCGAHRRSVWCSITRAEGSIVNDSYKQGVDR